MPTHTQTLGGYHEGALLAHVTLFSPTLVVTFCLWELFWTLSLFSITLTNFSITLTICQRNIVVVTRLHHQQCGLIKAIVTRLHHQQCGPIKHCYSSAPPAMWTYQGHVSLWPSSIHYSPPHCACTRNCKGGSDTHYHKRTSSANVSTAESRNFVHDQNQTLKKPN